MRRSSSRQRPEAFTLVELILVMALLCVILGVAAPSLSRSMHQRNLVQEATRLLALTEYARDEAISRGVPMVVWIDEDSGKYGVRAKSGYEDSGARAKDFTLMAGIHFDGLTASTGTTGSMQSSPAAQSSSSTQGSAGTGASTETAGILGDTAGNAAVEFAPDGTLDPSSDSSMRLADQSKSTMEIEQTNDATGYEIVKDTDAR